MNDPVREESNASLGVGTVTLVAAALVVLLAVASLFWPRTGQPSGAPALLVFDASGDPERVDGVYTDLAAFLAAASERELKLEVVTTVVAYRAALAEAPAFVLAPDGLALAAGTGEYLPMVAGRRPAPMNLRPRGVLVYRQSAGDVRFPWRVRRTRTVCGDSLSLAGSGALREAGLASWPAGLACGPDPYDHGPVLHALRLGAFDYALVRQWDAERFLAAGLLDPARYAVRDLVVPVPDAVLLVSRQVPRHLRLRCGEALSGLGRESGEPAPAAASLRRGLAQLHLTGFNLLVEPDFEQVRKKFAGSWLPASN